MGKGLADEAEEPIGLASDGEVDAELAKLLSELDEVSLPSCIDSLALSYQGLQDLLLYFTMVSLQPLRLF